MSNYSENKHLEQELILHSNSLPSLSIHNVSIGLIKQDDKIIECRLTFQVTPEIYQRINNEAIFNLKPEVRSPVYGGEFLSEINIRIEVTLKPDLLTQLLEKVNNGEEAATYLLNLSQAQSSFSSENQASINPLLNTENWLCLSVKQTQESGEVGYNTFWNFVNPSIINNPNTSSEQISQGIVNFVKEWTEANLSAATQNATTEMLQGMGNIFKDLVDEVFSKAEEDPSVSQTIFTAMVNFFAEDDWPYVQIEENTTLRLSFRGDNGQWSCYAKAREAEEQFVFYSLCPINASENKRQAIAEFITRANYGMMIGNFELDFNDGEIRYKTSIDIEADKLTSAMIKTLVYANVTMMDEYLPGIVAVLEKDISPAEAIAQIET